ncbi:alpha/beta hydrolase [Mesorhizobium sp. LHD-90]|uniref:alpha/beta fold hydrolase n=1 Tax=Mesorhizobium sp. LHD-90 TaxID=3071414 RepID=UPI0027E110AB|nr:alpha/beta hydrolase [Mesorhizobium sp. LHD-90]MDQ6435884.1 alpha/beta hydrolase [Mesorhizobium sp. LHD-90]
MKVRMTLLAGIAAAALLSGVPDVGAQATEKTTQTQGEFFMTEPKAFTLEVPGASIYYERQGSGPPLLIIPGGPQDAGVFAELSARLSHFYTVVTYDPRGNSRTTTDAPLGDLDLGVQADDAAALIDALGDGPAYVFGTSGGAQIGLELAVRHPAKVRTLVVHEPPAIMLLDDPTAQLAADKDIHDTYKREGVDAAMAKFFGMNDLDAGPGHGAEGQAAGEVPADAEPAGPPGSDMPPEAAETFVRVSGNFEYWLAHGMLPLSTYRPDVAALKAGAPRIVVAIGEGSAGQPIEEMGRALAKSLETAPVAFPGDHMGFEPHAQQFAEVLRRSFAGK